MGALTALPALDVKPVQQPDLLEKFGQLSALRNAQQEMQQRAAMAPLQQQAAQQSVQSGALDIQAKQQEMAARQATNAAFAGAVVKDANGNPSFDENKLAQGLAGGPAAYKTPEVMKGITDFHKERIGLQTSIVDLQDKQSKMLGAAATAVKAAGYDPTLAHSLLDQLPQSPQLDQIRQQIDNPQALKQLIDTAIQNSPDERKQILEQTKADQQAANEDAMRKQQAASLANTEQHQKVEERQGQQRLSIEGARLAFDKARQGTQDQQSIEAQAQQVATGDLKLPPQGRSNPLNAAIRARAFEINPNLSDELYATKQDFLSSRGKANAQVQSLNKLSAHLGELQQASDRAGFSPVGFTGAGKDLRLAEQLFGKEDVKFLSGAGIGTEGELNGLIEKTHSPIQSVRNDAINTLSKFTADAARQLGDQYERGTKLPFDPNQHFTPDTVKMLNSHGGTSARPAQGGNVAPEGTIVQTSNGPMIKRGGQWVKP